MAIAQSSPARLAWAFFQEASHATINSATQALMPAIAGNLQESASALAAYFQFWLVKTSAELAIKSFKSHSWAPYNAMTLGWVRPRKTVQLLPWGSVMLKDDPFHH